MGIGIFKGSSCGEDKVGRGEPLPAGNPNPRRFQILRTRQYASGSGSFATVAEVRYPDAKNYEGRKIMIYLCSAQAIIAQTTLDPHFCDNERHLSPFARFQPTERGWEVACRIAERLV